MNTQTVGTCSICGGRVTVPTICHCIYPPVPSCEACGATAAEVHGPVIDMKPSDKTTTTWSDSTSDFGSFKVKFFS